VEVVIPAAAAHLLLGVMFCHSLTHSLARSLMFTHPLPHVLLLLDRAAAGQVWLHPSSVVADLTAGQLTPPSRHLPGEDQDDTGGHGSGDNLQDPPERALRSQADSGGALLCCACSWCGAVHYQPHRLVVRDQQQLGWRGPAVVQEGVRNRRGGPRQGRGAPALSRGWGWGSRRWGVGAVVVESGRGGGGQQ